MFCTFFLSNRMTCFITAILVVLYLVFLIIKSFGKLLIFPTDYEDAQMEWKPSFLIELSNFIRRYELPLVVVGDFNMSRRDSDKNRAVGLNRCSIFFKSIISQGDLREIPLTCRRYTWPTKN